MGVTVGMTSNKSRKWLITLNNPEEHGFTKEALIEICKSLQPHYFCLCYETGAQGTSHVHLYTLFHNPRSFSAISKAFHSVAHLDIARGSSEENRNYIRKEGKWAETEKHETNHIETFYESGECPEEKQGKRNDCIDLVNMIKDGLTDYEIIEKDNKFMNRLENIRKTRNVFRDKQFCNTFRDVKVSYIYGLSRTGKTSYVLNTYGYENVYRVTDYMHPFDGYDAQDVILFDEFRSSLLIADMLKYLEGYPIKLPCRYENKQACYTKVFIVSNIALDKQYEETQLKEKETFEAFLNRLNNGIYEFRKDKKLYYQDSDFYYKGISYEYIKEDERSDES